MQWTFGNWSRSLITAIADHDLARAGAHRPAQPTMNAIGILACTLWPLAVFFVAIRWLKLHQRVV